MNRFLKNTLQSIGILAFIVFVCAIGYVIFVGGPARAYEKEDTYYVEAVVKQKGYESGMLLNRFAFDTVYYILEVNDNNQQKIVWFDKDLKTIQEVPYINLKTAKQHLGNRVKQDSHVNFGIYKDALVYVVKSKNTEIFYALDSLEILLMRGE